MNSPSEFVKEMAKSIVEHLDAVSGMDAVADKQRREEITASIIHGRLMPLVNTYTPQEVKQ